MWNAPAPKVNSGGRAPLGRARHTYTSGASKAWSTADYMEKGIKNSHVVRRVNMTSHLVDAVGSDQ